MSMHFAYNRMLFGEGKILLVGAARDGAIGDPGVSRDRVHAPGS
jgi:hypothetical protein